MSPVMSGPAQTPASKRFKATQSSSASASKSASARKSQFLRTPQATTSSPFINTPYRNQKGRTDDIETSFEDEVDDAENTTTNDARGQFQALGMTGRDGIEDDAIALPSAVSVSRERLYFSEENNTEHIDDKQDAFRSPLPKRQKRTHSHSSRYPVMLISSSPVEDSNAVLRDLGTEYRHLESVEDADSSDLIKEPTPISSRFLTPASAKFGVATDQTRPNFKGFLQQTAIETSTRSIAALPDAFSPSKRQGKKEYVRGGLADTTRNCILQIANEQTHQATEESMAVRLRFITTDESGRFEVAEDIESRTWMLVRQGDRLTRSTLSNMADSDGYTKICISNPATTWTIGLEDQAQLHVAVLWDVV